MKVFRHVRLGHVAALGAGLLLGLVSVGIGGAGAGSLPAAKAAVRHYTLAASALAPDSFDDVSENYTNLWDPSTLTDAHGARCYDAGLSLPSGARIVSVTFYYTRGASSGIYMEVNEQVLSNHTSKAVATFTSSATGTTASYTATTVPVNPAVTVSSTDAYSVGVCPAGDATFTAVTVNYK